MRNVNIAKCVKMNMKNCWRAKGDAQTTVAHLLLWLHFHGKDRVELQNINYVSNRGGTKK